MKAVRLVGASLLLGLLAGCSALPVAGPSAKAIEDQSGPQKQPDNSQAANFEIVPVDARVIKLLEARPSASLVGSFGDIRPSPDIRIGVGDTVALNIWDAQSLASSTASAVLVQGGPLAPSQVPEQLVSRQGTITVPFAGTVKVRGKTIPEAQAAIRAKLSQTLQDPQVILSVTASVANTVTVISDRGGSASVPLSIGGERILDLLAKSSGVKAPLFQTAIQLTRNGRSQIVPAVKVVQDPKENIYLQPGDIISVVNRVPKFVALGASSANREVPFDEQKINLSQALGKIGGLIDYRADPEGVFLFRYEPKDIAGSLNPDSQLAKGKEALVPVIYRFNMRDPSSFFLAHNFAIENRDILYVANAPLVEWQKFMSLIQLFTQPAVSGASIQYDFSTGN